MAVGSNFEELYARRGAESWNRPVLSGPQHPHFFVIANRSEKSPQR